MDELLFVGTSSTSFPFVLIEAGGGMRYFVVVLAAVFLSVSCGGERGSEREEEPIIRFASSELVVRPHETYAILEWTLPRDRNLVRSIQVEVGRGGEVEKYSVGLRETSYRVDGLEEGEDYDFRVIFTYEDGSLGRLNKEGVRTGLNTDGDQLIDEDDPDDDGDRVPDSEEAAKRCQLVRDCDNDGTDDGTDAFPTDPAETMDSDGDGMGDNADAFPNDPTETMDSDGDRMGDNGDAFPNDPTETMDSDGDGTGNNADMNDDRDGLLDTDTKESLQNRAGELCGRLTDCDRDGVNDDVDLDLDGDGLIEVQMQEELDAVRYVLNGTGRRFDEREVVDVLGCDGCRGYELVNNLTLSYEDPAGWQPLGGNVSLRAFNRVTENLLGKTEGGSPYCRDGSKEAKGFDGVFEGNGWTISNLSINLPDRDCVGLFAKAKGEVRNLFIEGDRIVGKQLVGVVVGDGSFTTIRNVHARTRWLSGQGNSTIGGLVGSIYWGSLINSTAVTDSLTGNGTQTGGLVGAAIFSNISDSAAMTTNLTGGSTIVPPSGAPISAALGGLVGYCKESAIDSSFSIAERIKSISPAFENEHKTGGLAGQCAGTAIRDSYALSGTIEGRDENNSIGGNNIGGLVGQLGGPRDSKGRQVMIDSYAITEGIGGRDRVGGLEGGTGDTFSSFAITANLVTSIGVGGLLGSDSSTTVWNSYAISGTIHAKSSGQAGGLVSGLTSGNAASHRIVASYGIVHTMQGPGSGHSGLAGALGKDASILSSYAMMVNTSDSTRLGGLVGSVSTRVQTDGDDVQANIIASYGVGNVSSPGLYRRLTPPDPRTTQQVGIVNIVSSYWDNLNGSRDLAILRNGSLAAIWTDETELVDRAVWCDLNQNEMIDMAEKRPDNRIWDFGENMRAEYPIIGCTPPNPLGLAQTRWRSLKDGKPNIPDSAELRGLISNFRAEQRALFPQHIADQ